MESSELLFSDICPDLSLIVLSYNNLEYLERFVNNISLCRGNYFLEVIFIDDGTKDAQEIYHSLLKNYRARLRASTISRILIIFKTENKGIVDSVLTGITKASGKYINFKSIDDLYCIQFLQKILDEISFSKHHIIHFPFLYYREKTRIISKIKPEISFFYKSHEQQLEEMLTNYKVVVGACLFRSTILQEEMSYERIKLFKYSLERPLMLELTQKGYQVIPSKKASPLYIYVRNKKSISNWLFTSDVFYQERNLLSQIYGINFSNKSYNIASRIYDKFKGYINNFFCHKLSFAEEQDLYNSKLDLSDFDNL